MANYSHRLGKGNPKLMLKIFVENIWETHIQKENFPGIINREFHLIILLCHPSLDYNMLQLQTQRWAQWSSGVNASSLFNIRNGHFTRTNFLNLRNEFFCFESTLAIIPAHFLNVMHRNKINDHIHHTKYRRIRSEEAWRKEGMDKTSGEIDFCRWLHDGKTFHWAHVVHAGF